MRHALDGEHIGGGAQINRFEGFGRPTTLTEVLQRVIDLAVHVDDIIGGVLHLHEQLPVHDVEIPLLVLGVLDPLEVTDRYSTRVCQDVGKNRDAPPE